MERIVTMTGAFDKRHSDPKKNYGIHGMEIRFVLKGPAGAVQFVVYTQIHLEHVAKEQWAKRNEPYAFKMSRPMGVDIGYHAPTPHYEGQTEMECDLLPGGKCYYDGTSLGAENFMPTFIAGGSDAVWRMLEEKYHTLFSGASE